MGAGQQAQRNLGGHAEGTFRADKKTREIVARPLGTTAEFDDLAIGQHPSHAQNMIGGYAILKAMNAARVFGNVAPNRANLLTGGVGGIVVACTTNGLGHAVVDDTGLHRNALVIEINIDNAAHPGRGNHDTVGCG